MATQQKRRDGWEIALAEYIESRAATPFAWGSHDCCAFTAAAIEAMAGSNPTLAVGDYSTALQAERVIEGLGGIEAIPDACGFARLPSVRMAKRGDVMLYDFNGRLSLGICCGELSFFASHPSGLAANKTLACVASWRVE